MNKNYLLLISLLIIFLVGCSGNTETIEEKKVTELHTIPCENYEQMEAYFKYSPDAPLIVSGHRGGVAEGYPENSIEAMEQTLTQMPSFFEIDPRITKDSVLVLMHDSSLDRTTTGYGLVKDYTYAELQELNLIDLFGNETPYKIPTVEEVIKWSQGKTILNFDKKDAPREMLVKLVNKLGAKNIIYTVHNPEDAMLVYNLDKDAHFSAWMKDLDAFKAYEKTGIPMSRFIAYVVSTTMNPQNQELYDALHNAGIRCMISMSPSHDKIPSSKKRIVNFKKEVEKGPDIIETDFPTEFIGLY